jgi:hypothetical protein
MMAPLRDCTSKEKSAWRPPRCAGDGPHALSVSASRMRLGQDRFSGVLESGAVRVSERYLRVHITACQKIRNFHMRFKLMQRTER